MERTLLLETFLVPLDFSQTRIERCIQLLDRTI